MSSLAASTISLVIGLLLISHHFALSVNPNPMPINMMIVLNRLYGVSLADESDAPVYFIPPANGPSDLLYTYAAQQLFPKAEIEAPLLFISARLKPRGVDTQFYLFSLQDVDKRTRMSYRMTKTDSPDVDKEVGLAKFTVHPVDLPEPVEIEYYFEWNENRTWWIGIEIKEDQVSFYMECNKNENDTGPYHTKLVSGIVGKKLFTPGASFYILNSGREKKPDWFQGDLNEFMINNHTITNQVGICKGDNIKKGSVDEDSDPYQNVVIPTPPMLASISCDCKAQWDLFMHQLKQHDLLRGPAGPPGIQGLPGPAGPPGTCPVCPSPAPQSSFDSKSPELKALIRETLAELLSEKDTINRLRGPAGPQGPKGEEGKCTEGGPSSSEAQLTAKVLQKYDEMEKAFVARVTNAINKVGYGALVMEDRRELSQFAYKLPPGTMAYVREDKEFYLKTSEDNTWRTIELSNQNAPMYLPKPMTTRRPPRAPFPTVSGKKLYLAAVNTALMGNLHIPGGNWDPTYMCQSQAKESRVGRAFLPLVTMDSLHMDYIITETYRYNVPIVNMKGEQLFEDFRAMINAEARPTAAILDFEGNNIAEDPLFPCIWTGAKPLSLSNEAGGSAKCRNWQSTHPNETGLAVNIPLKDDQVGLLSPGNHLTVPCSNRCRLLCIQLRPEPNLNNLNIN